MTTSLHRGWCCFRMTWKAQDLLQQGACRCASRPSHRDRRALKRGEKREMVDHALTNAREALGRRLAESSSQLKLLEGVAEAFGLEETPRRIEVYDNSHIMGTNAVGGMIVAGAGGLCQESLSQVQHQIVRDHASATITA